MTQVPLPAEHGIASQCSDTHPLVDRNVHPVMPLLQLLPLAALALMAGLGAVTWIAHAGEVCATGFLRAEQSAVYSPRSGRVDSVSAHTGDSVKPRQTLLQLVDDSLDREIAAKSREVHSLEAALEQCRAKADVQMSLQIKSLDEELHRTRLQSAEYLRQHYAASFEHVTWRNFMKESHAGRWLPVAPVALSEPDRIFSSLVTDSVLTPEEVRLRAMMRQEEARNSAEVTKAQADLCDHHIHELQELRQTLPERIRKAAGVDVAEAKLAQATEQFNSLNQQKAAMTVTAPGYGIVGSYTKQAADPVSEGEALVTVLDRDRPFVEVDVPSREIGRLQVGQKIPLEFAGADRIGRVETISPQAHRRDSSVESWIAVRIRPAGRLWPEVPIGSAVSVRLK
ncbi:MAG TPA: HlyD family efflux transporter periplasmic adaptor subunit [Planctomycetaceae bacterium]|nr:HlyD family efflux transporter periplasmic adaptor subunit [Planctomycetaceae bacterium]